MANWFSLFPTDILKHPKVTKNDKSLKTALSKTFNKLNKDLVIADRDWNGKDPWMIKVDKKNFDKIKKEKFWKEGQLLDGGKQWKVDTGVPKKNPIQITWRKSSKVVVSKASTREQELGSAYIFKRALNDNKGWKDWQAILKDKTTYKELVKIWGGEIDEEWLISYFAQTQIMLEKFKPPIFKQYNREGGFMDWISGIAKKCGYSQKDTWNPADIWVIKNKSTTKIEQEIEGKVDAILGSKKPGTAIYAVNNILRKYFNSKHIIGISLKKTKAIAYWEEINVDGLLFDTSDKDNNFPCDGSNFSCSFDIKKGKDNFTQDVRLTVSGAGSSSQEFSFQIKANSPEAKGGSNLKFEASMKGAGSARLGKAPVDQLAELLADFNPSEKFTNKYADYPADLNAFMKPGVQTKWKKKIQTLLAAGMTAPKGESNLKITEIMKNIQRSYLSKNDRDTNTRCKLMGIQFFCSLLSLINVKPDHNPDTTKLREFVTDMVYICQKKATKKTDHYGPFGKIY